MEIGEVYGKYRLIERIATGGMAEVYKAMAVGEAGFEKPVAIKRLHRQFGEDEDLVAMLQDEARLCSLLNHGNICQVLDLGRVDDTYYIAMEYVNGRDLFVILRKASRTERRMPLPAALLIACEVLAGLDYAHRKRTADGRMLHIIHRDISPQNVLITFDGEVKIIDFGIAKARTSTHRTQAGVIKGKFRYMSPEQARGEPIDHRTDIFASAVVLYEMISGSPHAAGSTDREILIKIQTSDFEPLGQIVPGLPADLEEMVHRGLALNPDSRWSSARAFRKALMSFMRTNGLAFSRDDLAEYIRALFVEDSGSGTQVEQIEALDDVDLRGPSLLPEPRIDAFAPTVRPIDDPFAPGLAPVHTVGLSKPAERPPSEPADVTVSLRESGQVDAGFPTGPPAHRPPQPVAPSPQPSPHEPSRPAPVSSAAPRTAPETHGATGPGAPGAIKRPSVLLAIGRAILTLGLLGLMGIGGYYVWVLYFKKPPPLNKGKGDGKRLVRADRQGRPIQVKASLYINSRPKGARIFLGGQDTALKTPGRFPDMEVPSMLLVELRHKRFKRPWQRVIRVGNGDEVRFTADLRNPPSGLIGKPTTGRRFRLPSKRSRRRPTAPTEEMPADSNVEVTDVAQLAVVADVKGAEVWINGVRRGRTPFFRKVRPATFKVQVRHGKRRSRVRTVQLRPGKDEVVRFTLGR